MSQPTIFGRILDGEIPCHRVYEDDHVLAFLDINPVARGHVLVIPKERVARMDELSDAAAASLGRALPRICRGVMQVTGATDYNLLVNCGSQAGQDVFHVHMHIIPRTDGSGFGIRWQPGTLDPDAAPQIAADIAQMIR